MKITDKNKLNETELTLAIPEELLEKAKEVAEATKEDEMFPFTLRYDANRTADLKIMLQATDVHPEKEAENSVTAYMNMAQLQLLKGLEFVEQVIAEDTGHRKELKDFICQEGPVPAASRTETEAEATSPVNHVDANSEGAVAEAAAGDHAAVAVQSSCCGCPTNKDMESAQMISAGSYVSGCICCPGAEQWFKFTVPVSKTYTIYTSGSLDTIGTLLDCCGNVLATNDDYAGKLNFRMIQNLTVGTTYYVRVRAFGNTTGSYTFRVTDRIFASGVSISQTSITLEKGVLYELPITPNYTYKGYLGAKRIPGLSVSVIPANADEQKVWWWEHYDGVLKCSYGWDDDGDRYIHVIANGIGTSKLYAQDWNENGLRGECTVYVGTAPVTAKTFYNIVSVETGKVVNINGSYLVNLSGGENITLYDKSGSNEQVWEIDMISDTEDCYIRSYIDQAYGFNAHRKASGNYNCNIHKIAGNETDAAVHFVPQADGSYKIKLANYSNYYLTATASGDGSDIRWQPEDHSKNQHWSLIDFSVEQREIEKKEYHIIPFFDIHLDSKRALQVDMNTPNDGGYVNKNYRLANDEKVELGKLSYINKQKWLLKGTDTRCKIYTAHGDNYCLCKKSDSFVYLSNNNSYESDITVINCDPSQSLVRIKLTSSNLYLTLSDVGIVWSSFDNNSNTQIWKIAEKPNEIHNGADSATCLYHASMTDKDKTIRACRLGGEEFVARYYADVDKITNKGKILTVDESNSLHNHGIKIISIYQDSADYAAYFNANEGQKDAMVALSLANERNQPAGSAIYFAVDYDASNQEMDNIKAYFSAIKSVFDSANINYKIGVYGNGLVCSTIKGLYAEYSWLSRSTGHYGYPQYDTPERYNLKQAEEIFYNNIHFDDNIAVGDDYGQW